VRFTHIRSEGDGAWAGFYAVDTGTTTLVISVWNNCLNAEVRSLVGTTTQQELQVDPNLGAATLLCTLPVLDDVTGTFVNVTLDLVWDATGGFIRDRGGDREHFENGMSIVRSSGSSRDAVATGTLFLDGAERTLPPTTEAQVEGNTRREITIIRN
jgi:hypothetical protein